MNCHEDQGRQISTYSIAIPTMTAMFTLVRRDENVWSASKFSHAMPVFPRDWGRTEVRFEARKLFVRKMQPIKSVCCILLTSSVLVKPWPRTEVQKSEEPPFHTQGDQASLLDCHWYILSWAVTAITRNGFHIHLVWKVLRNLILVVKRLLLVHNYTCLVRKLWFLVIIELNFRCNVTSFEYLTYTKHECLLKVVGLILLNFMFYYLQGGHWLKGVSLIRTNILKMLQIAQQVLNLQLSNSPLVTLDLRRNGKL